MSPSRNEPCPCGSGLKYKKCCLPKPFPADEQSDNSLRIRADAFKAMSLRQWSEAVSLFKSIVDATNDPVEIRSALASCYEASDDYLMACEWYEKAIAAADPPRANLFYYLGAARGCAQRIDKAIEAFERCLELETFEANRTHVNDILRTLGQIQEGKMPPSVFLVQVNLQRAFSELDEELYEDARARLGTLLTIAPDNPVIHYNLGVAETFLKREEEALKHFQRTVDIFPGYYQAWYNMGQIYLIHKKDCSQALSCFDMVSSLNPQYIGGHHQRAVALECLGDKEGALKNWKNTLELDPQNAAAKDAIKRLE